MINSLPKTALTIGITGRDGAYLAEFLLAKGHAVHGPRRRASTDDLARLKAFLSSAAAWERLAHENVLRQSGAGNSSRRSGRPPFPRFLFLRSRRVLV